MKVHTSKDKQISSKHEQYIKNLKTTTSDQHNFIKLSTNLLNLTLCNFN